MNPCKLSKALLLVVLPILFICTAHSFGQSAPKRILGTFIYSKQVYNYEFTKAAVDNYTLVISSLSAPKGDDESETKTDLADTVTKSDQPEEDLNYIFADFDKEKFAGIFKAQMESKFELNDDDKKELTAMGEQLFFGIQAKLDFLDDEPVTAHLILKKDDISSVLKARPSSAYNGRLSALLVKHSIERVSVEIEAGTIKNISVYLIEPGIANSGTRSVRSHIEFKNEYPITISAKFDPEKFADINLYSVNCAGIKGLSRYIKLSDLLMFDIVLENDKVDYSPANSTVELSPTSPIVELKKERRSKIIEVSAFSDFVGIDQDQPNGLIQIEAKKKINLRTKHSNKLWRSKVEDKLSKYDLNEVDFALKKDVKGSDSLNTYFISKKDTSTNKILMTGSPEEILDVLTFEEQQTTGVYYNFFGAIEPKVLISKLEENNRYLLLDANNLDGNKIRSLNVFQHQLVSFGATLNFVKLSFPSAKVTWNVLDVGGYWYRTRVKMRVDSASSFSEPLNSSYWIASTGVSFRPDSRWGFDASAFYIKHQLLNPNYQLDHNKGLFNTGVDGYLKTNNDSKLFLRYRWIFDMHDFNRNYTQFQIGYSMNLFVDK